MGESCRWSGTFTLRFWLLHLSNAGLAFLSLSFLFPLLYFLLAPLPIGQKKPQLTARRLHFVVVYVQFPEDYPSSAPQIQFLTTNGGKTRFNPNLYADGKVCLSILGTWRGESGEQWSSVQNCQVFTPIFSSLLHFAFPSERSTEDMACKKWQP